MDDIIEEFKIILDEICEKFSYNSEDKEGNDSLKTVLLKAVPCMLKDSSPEDRKLFYQMLQRTPIVIADVITKEDEINLIKQYMGDVNPHIHEEQSDIGEYGKDVAKGAYNSAPILDENLQLIGKKSFIFISKAPEDCKELFGTEIHVAHLIHEMGHAWHAEKDEYTMNADGTLSYRVGTAQFTYSFSKGNDGKYIQKRESVTGLMVEEGMNTVDEENAMTTYLGVSMEKLKDIYRSTIIPSAYQGIMSDTVRYMLEKLHKNDFEQWRLYGDLESKQNIEALMEGTKYWENRETDILPNSDSPRNYDKKREIIDRCTSPHVKEFFNNYNDIYFPDVSKMTPLDKIENVLFQNYNMGMTKYTMGIENYRDFSECMCAEIYPLINQASDLAKNSELAKSVSSLSLSEINNITRETRTQVTQDKTIAENINQQEQGENK